MLIEVSFLMLSPQAAHHRVHGVPRLRLLCLDSCEGLRSLQVSLLPPNVPAGGSIPHCLVHSP